MRNTLSLLNPNVLSTRLAYREALRELPIAVERIAVRHLQERSVRSPGRPLLGEYAPWLIADALGIEDVQAVQRVATAWLHVYFFTLMLDDVVDGSMGCASGGELIVGSLLLQRGILRLQQNDSSGRIHEHIESAFVRTAEAAIDELEDRRRRIRALSQSPLQAGQKITILRICARAVADLVGREDSGLDRVVDNLVAGIQILDDITDLEEDRAIERVSVPLALLAMRDDVSTIDVSRNELLTRLIETNVLTEALAAARTALEKARREIDDLRAAESGKIACEYVEGLITSIAESVVILQSARRRLAGSERPESIVVDVERALRIVAQGS